MNIDPEKQTCAEIEDEILARKAAKKAARKLAKKEARVIARKAAKAENQPLVNLTEEEKASIKVARQAAKLAAKKAKNESEKQIGRWAKFSFITDEPYSYYKDDTIYSSRFHPRGKRLWAQELSINGPIMTRLSDLSREYSKKYTILAQDKDRHDFQPVYAEGLRLVASLTSQSDSKTYPIPQHDSYFKNKTAFPNKPLVPFEAKKSMVVWRGATSATRRKLVSLMKNSPHFDVEFTNDKMNRMSPSEQIHYKYVLAIDGHGWPGSLNWTLESGSVPLVHSKHHLWYFPLLEPWVDYVPVTMENFDDVFERLENSPFLAKKIAESSVEKIQRIHHLQDEYLELIFKTESYSESIQILKERLSQL